MKTVIAALLLSITFLGCIGGYSGTDWRGIFEKQQGEKIEIEGFIGGALPSPEQIYNKGELKGYLLDAPFGKQKTGLPLILTEQLNCDSNHVKIRGEIVKRGVQPMGNDFIEMLDWELIKVESFDCIK
jgi:hypothetical protein